MQDTTELIPPAQKGKRMSCLESYYTQAYQRRD